MKSIVTITKYTFKEYVKGKVILSVVFLAIALLLATLVSAELTYKTVHRVAVDIGFGLATISAVTMSIFLGVTLISSEIENRTLYMVLSKPISRIEFFIGKFFGLSLMSFVNVLVLTSQTFVLSIFFGGNIDPLFFYVSGLIFIEALVVLSLTILFSLFTNKYLSIFFVFVLYTVGHALDSTVQTKVVASAPILKLFLYILEYILPMFYKLNFKDFLLYETSLPFETILHSFAYGFFYILFINTVSLLIFTKKDLD